MIESRAHQNVSDPYQILHFVQDDEHGMTILSLLFRHPERSEGTAKKSDPYQILHFVQDDEHGMTILSLLFRHPERSEGTAKKSKRDENNSNGSEHAAEREFWRQFIRQK